MALFRAKIRAPHLVIFASIMTLFLSITALAMTMHNSYGGVGNYEKLAATAHYTFTRANELRASCTTALENYNDKPDQLGNTDCGRYIQGFLEGLDIGVTEGLVESKSPQLMTSLEKIMQEKLCHQSDYTLKQYIEDYIFYSATLPDSIFSKDAILVSIVASCTKMHAAQMQSHQAPIEHRKNLPQHKSQ